MKKIIIIITFIALFSNCTNNNTIISIDPSLSNPNEISIAVITTQVEGYPNINNDIILTDKFSLGLK